jgi:hypothetical protein
MENTDVISEKSALISEKLETEKLKTSSDLDF